jgi:hypothetical protein
MSASLFTRPPENIAGDTFKMADEEYGSGLGKRVAELLLVDRFLSLSFRNADTRAMISAAVRASCVTCGYR